MEAGASVTLHKPTLCIDFDGVIHSYHLGWNDGTLYGTVLPGFFEWARRADQQFRLVIYSSRSSTIEGRLMMHQWLMSKYAEWLMAQGDRDLVMPLQVAFEHKKPAAFLTIDDRCVQFMGDWNDPGLSPQELLAFKPWNGRRENSG